MIEDRGYSSPCWIWKYKPFGPAGYCRVKFQGNLQMAHRAVYEQNVGPIPEGLQIDHLCFQTACVNPAHLEPVTAAENMRRQRSAKLTIADARHIRESSLTPTRLATLYDVSRGTISEIRRGETWRED